MGTYKKVVPKDTVIKFRTQVGILQGIFFSDYLTNHTLKCTIREIGNALRIIRRNNSNGDSFKTWR